MGWQRLAAVLVTLPLHLGAGIPELSAEEEAALAKGEPVSRWEATTGHVLGIVDVDAPPHRVLEAVIDLPAREEDQRAIKSVEIYSRTAGPERLSARWIVSLATFRSVFHVVYEVDRSAGTCTWWLDESQDNDIEATRGSYEILPRAAGSRVLYRGFSDTGRSTPNWVRRWLSVDSLEAQLGGIKRRSELDS